MSNLLFENLAASRALCFNVSFFHQDGEGKTEKVEKKEKEKKEKKEKTDDKDEKAGKKDKKDKKEEKVKATPLQKDQERAKGLQLEEENEIEEPEASVEDTGSEVKRGSRKAWFFNKNYDTLPQAAKDLFDSKKVSRSHKTQLVNSMVQKSSNGKGWVLDTESPVLTALSRHFKSLVREESLVSRVSTFLFFFCLPKFYLPKFGLEDSKIIDLIIHVFSTISFPKQGKQSASRNL